MVTYGPWQEGLEHYETMRFGSAYPPGTPGAREIHSSYPNADSGLRSFRQVAVTSIRQGRTAATVRYPADIPSPTQTQIDDASNQAYDLEYRGYSRTYTYPGSDSGASDPWSNYPTAAGATLSWSGSGMVVGYDTVMELDGLAWVKDYQKAKIAPSAWPAGAVGIEYRANYEVEFIDASVSGWTGTAEERQGDNAAPWIGGSLGEWICYRKNPGSGLRLEGSAWIDDPTSTLTLANGTGGQAAFDSWLGRWGAASAAPITDELNALKVPRVGTDPATGQPISVAWDSDRGVWYNTADPAVTYTASYSSPASRLEWTWGPNGNTIPVHDLAIGTITKRLTATAVTVDVRWRSAPYRFLFDSPTHDHIPPLRQFPRDDNLGTSSAARIWPVSSQQGSLRRHGYF